MRTFSPLIIIPLFFIISCLSLYPQGQSGTNIDIKVPSENGRISGYSKVLWDIAGPNSNNFWIKLKPPGCGGEGTIIISNLPPTSTGKHEYEINTNNYNDGIYCLEVCLHQNGNEISCSNKQVQIVNDTNRAPVITSFPDKINLKSTDFFQYKLEAQDPEGDPIAYRPVSTPDFIFMDYLGNLSFGDIPTKGIHTLTIGVIDIHGASTLQTFQLSIDSEYITPRQTPSPTTQTTPQTPIQTTVQPTTTIQSPTPPNTPMVSISTTSFPTPTISEPISPSPSSPTPSVPPTVENLKIIFRNPVGSSKFSGRSNIIEWEIKGVNEYPVFELRLSYTYEGLGEYKPLVTLQNPNLKKYEWNVENLDSGDTYQLKIELLDEKRELVKEKVSEIFEINMEDATKTPSPTTTQTEDVSGIRVTNIFPEEDSIISEQTPQISAVIETKDDISIIVDSIVVKLDGLDITADCEKSPETISCDTLNLLEEGEHNVQIQIDNTKEETFSKSWNFIVDPNLDGTSDGFFDQILSYFRDLQNQNVALLVGICAGIIFFFGIFLFIFNYLRNRGKDTFSEQTLNDNEFTGFGGDEQFEGSLGDVYGDDNNLEQYDYTIGEYDNTKTKDSTDTTTPEELPAWVTKNETSDPVTMDGGELPTKDPVADIGEDSQLQNNFGLTSPPGIDDEKDNK